MGLTLNCAQCHTHKYDPVLHTDYFSVMALLNNADEPTYHIPTPDLEARQADHARRLRVAEETLEGKFPGGPAAVEKRFGEWLDAQSPRASRWEDPASGQDQDHPAPPRRAARRLHPRRRRHHQERCL
jgi:hypothetical protein